MTRVGVAITKVVTWRGQPEEFSNVYHYDTGFLGSLIPGDAGALIDKLVALEKPVHSSWVTFKTGRVWETGGTPAENETVLIKDLSGAGTMSTVGELWYECAGVVNIATNRNTSTGRKIYLRKYIHTCAVASSASGIAAGRSGWDSTTKSLLQAYGEAIREFTILATNVTCTLEAPGGQNAGSGAPVTVLTYPHVRQFKQ